MIVDMTIDMTRINLSVIVLASATLLLAGCGGTSSPGVAHLSSSTPGGSAADGAGKASTPESGASAQQKMVAYSQCMRTHGVPEFPEPTEGHLLIHSGNHNGHVTGVNPQSSQFQAALKVCGKLVPEGGTPSPAQQAKVQESALKFSQCMRTHGVPNFPDPTFSGGGARLTLEAGGANGIDPNSPQFKAAQKTCQSVMPGPRGGPGGGGLSTSSSGGPGGSGGESGVVAVP
jgi:hypothetical protein